MFNTVLGNLLVRLTGDSTQFEKMIAGAEAVFDRAGKKLMGVGSLMTRALTLPLAAIGGLSVKAASDFDQAMAHSLVKFGSLSDGMKRKMEENARTIANNSTTSSVDLAHGYGLMADAGMKATNALTDMDYIQKFAFRNSLTLEKGIAFLTDSMAELGLESNDPKKNLKNMIELGDMMTRTTELAGVSIEELAKSLEKHGGSAMRRFNIDAAEGLGLLAAFAAQGAKAGQGGQYLADLLGERRLGTRRGVSGDALAILERNSLFAKQVQDQLKSKSTKGLVERESADMLRNFNDQMTILWNNVKDVGIDIGRILIPALEWFNKKLSAVIGWWHGLSDETKKWSVYIGVAVGVLGPLLTLLGFVVTGIAAINYTCIAWLAVLGAITLVAVAVTDAILQMTGKGNLGLIDLVGAFRVGGYQIKTYLTIAMLEIQMKWDEMFTSISVALLDKTQTIRAGWEVMTKGITVAILELKIALRGLLDKLAEYEIMVNRIFHKDQGIAGPTVGAKAGEVGAKAGAAPGSPGGVGAKAEFGVGAKAQGVVTQQDLILIHLANRQREFALKMKQALTSDARALSDQKVRDILAKAEATIAKYKKEREKPDEFKVPGLDLPDFGSTKGKALGREQEFQQISLRRFSLSGPTTASNKKTVQNVQAKGVEDKLDTLNQTMKSRTIVASLG